MNSTTSEFSPRPPLDGQLIGYTLEPEVFGFGSRPTDWTPGEPIIYQGDQHSAVFSPTGGGKGVGLIIPTLLTWPGALITLDVKSGENYAVTARRRRELGQRTICLDPFRLLGPDSDALNPFDLFDLAGVDLESEAQWMANLLSLGNRFSKDPFWDLSACGLLSSVITHPAATGGEKRNFRGFLETMMSDDLTYHLACTLDNEGATMNRLAHWEMASYLQLPERETRPSVYGTAIAYLKAFQSETVLSTLTKSTFSLQDVVGGAPLSIYLVMPPFRLASHRSYIKLIIGVLLRAIMSRRNLPPRNTLVILDEVAQLEKFEFLQTMLTLCRGYGLQVMTIWQDLDQIRSCFSSFKTILNNSGVLSVFGITNYRAAEEWAELLGVSPDSLMNLKPDEQMLLIRGEPARRAGRCHYLTDNLFQGLFDPNPFFAQRGSLAAANETTRQSESSVNSVAAAWTRRIRPKKDEPQVKIVEGENDFPFANVESLRIGSAHATARPDQEDRIEALLNTLVESINRRTVTSPESQPVRRDYR